MGYPIGSGEIESAHKSIPQKRMKTPDASWDADSIDPMFCVFYESAVAGKTFGINKLKNEWQLNDYNRIDLHPNCISKNHQISTSL